MAVYAKAQIVTQSSVEVDPDLIRSALYQPPVQNRRPQQIPDRVYIVVNTVATSSEISGIVDVCMNKSHSGLFIELHSTLKALSSSSPSTELIPISRTQLSPTFHQLCGTRKATLKADLTTFHQFPFRITPPVGSPPTFDSSLFSIEYKLVILMKKYGEYVTLKEKVVQFLAQIVEIRPSQNVKNSIEKEICIHGVKVILGLPRDEFLVSESIPFTLKLFDSLRVGVKKVAVSLIRKTELGQGEKEEGKVLECVTFKRFLKREICQRSGKFKEVRGKIATFVATDGPLFSIGYEIEIQIVTLDGKTTSGKVPLTLGTISKSPLPSGPQLGEGDSLDPLPSAPPRSMSFLSVRSSSLLSLFPPSYSQLGSRRASVASIQTLPPHYDDVT